MIKPAIILVLTLSSISCGFDENRVRDIRLPLALEVSNTTEESFHSGLIYSTTDADVGLSIPVPEVSAGDTRYERVPDAVYNDIKKQHFVFEGTCGSNTHWKSNNSNSTTVFVDSEETWSIDLRITSCM